MVLLVSLLAAAVVCGAAVGAVQVAGTDSVAPDVGASGAVAHGVSPATGLVASAAPVTSWRILLLVYRETDADYVGSDGATHHLHATTPQSDVDALVAAMNGSIPAAVREWSSGQASWNVDVRYPSQPITRLAALDATDYWVDPSCISEAIAQYNTPGTYDHVMVYWRPSDDAGNSIPTYGWGLASRHTNPDYGYATVLNLGWTPWNAGVADMATQVWIHEWLHSVSWFYAGLGYRMPQNDADGAESHGYAPDQASYPGWGTYYADLMNDRVSENGAMTGIPAAAWAKGTIKGPNATSAPADPIVTVTAGAHGSITPGTGPVTYGANATYAITPDQGYRVATLTVDGAAQTPQTSWTFASVTTAHSIAATFSAPTFTITPIVNGGGGTVTPASPQTVALGATPTFTFTPEADWAVAEVRVDGMVVARAVTAYTFAPVTADHTLTVTFLTGSPLPPHPGPITTVAPSPATVKHGKVVALRYRVNEVILGGRADVTITIKDSAGKVAARTAVKAVLMNTTHSLRFTCDLRRGIYRFSVSAASAGARSTNAASNTLTVR
jgi:hypothetical protein